MLETLNLAWEKLEPIRKISNEEFELSALENIQGIDDEQVLFCINNKNQKGLFIKDVGSPLPLPKHGCSRIEISRQIILIEGKEENFIKIICLEESLNYAFSILATRIIKFIIEGFSPTKATIEAVNELRKLLSRSKGPLPKEEEIIGLTGELIFIQSLIKNKTNLWKGWNGPFKASKDFTMGNIDVELKASLQSGEPSITVNNLNQLEPIEGRYLFLFHSTLVKNPNGEITVPNLVDYISNNIDDKDEFLDTLFIAGYSIEHKDLWQEYKFSLVEKTSYRINDEFPKINQNSFVNESIPESICKIRYDIELKKVQEFKINNEELYSLLLENV
tara:strand:+ start:1754 stop:2752 length:999 start_codon:yes stop_codon:yes gene_type:complete